MPDSPLPAARRLPAPDDLDAKALDDFARQVRAAARILWRGDDPNALFNFVDSLNSAVTRGYAQAWTEGAKACGILPADRTPEEQRVLDEYISIAQQRLMPLAEFIAQNSRASGGKWADIQPRLGMWINRYTELRNRAQQMSCKDQKLKWIFGDTKHCIDCKNLNGRIYRASVWAKYNLRPQMRELACSGFNCACAFQVTDEPVTPGHPPALRGING